ncbi:hypothetical protein, partial [Staphylococcus aureus]|uniref:hypothetical protein n=4 Tax=Staphylococcus aureus TaxID=1280 RepID=UPI001ED98B7D
TKQKRHLAMYIAQAKCPSNLNALSFLLSKITSHSKTNKKGKYSKFEHLPSLYIEFNINIDGGGRGIRTPASR